MREKRNAHIILVGNTEGKRRLGRRGWEGNIEINLKDIGLYDVDWIHLAQD
jgi:hypothetical protein